MALQRPPITANMVMNLEPERCCGTCRYWQVDEEELIWGRCAVLSAYLAVDMHVSEARERVDLQIVIGAYSKAGATACQTLKYEWCQRGYEPRI